MTEIQSKDDDMVWLVDHWYAIAQQRREEIELLEEHMRALQAELDIANGAIESHDRLICWQRDRIAELEEAIRDCQDIIRKELAND